MAVSEEIGESSSDEESLEEADPCMLPASKDFHMDGLSDGSKSNLLIVINGDEWSVSDEDEDEQCTKTRSRRKSVGKRVRFETNPDGSLMAYTHVYKQGSKAELWWNYEEMERIQADCHKVVDRCQHGKPARIEAISNLYLCPKKAKDKKRQNQAKLLKMVGSWEARGLEGHVNDVSTNLGAKHVKAVLRKQKLLRIAGAKPKEIQKAIRRSAKIRSRHSVELAQRLGQYDMHEALRAVLTSWS
jgi:putative ubiquitin-RnfH superfamily antitoxin RatB of RatAB toxin-antitoxin module